MLKEKNTEFQKETRVFQLNKIFSKKRINFTNSKSKDSKFTSTELNQFFVDCEIKFSDLCQKLSVASKLKNIGEIVTLIEIMRKILNHSEIVQEIPLNEFFKTKSHLILLELIKANPEIINERLVCSNLSNILICLSCGNSKQIFETFGENFEFLWFVDFCLNSKEFAITQNAFYILSNLSCDYKDEIAIYLAKKKMWKSIFESINNFGTDKLFEEVVLWFFESIIESVSIEEKSALVFIFDMLAKLMEAEEIIDAKNVIFCIRILVLFSNNNLKYLGGGSVSQKVESLKGYKFEIHLSKLINASNEQIIAQLISLYVNLSKSILLHVNLFFPKKVVDRILVFFWSERGKYMSQSAVILKNLILSDVMFLNYIFNKNFAEQVLKMIETNSDAEIVANLLGIFKAVLYKATWDIVIEILIDFQLFNVLVRGMGKRSDSVQIIILQIFEAVFERGDDCLGNEANEIVTYYSNLGFEWKVFEVLTDDSCKVIQLKNDINDNYCPNYFQRI